jgi:hypothetical protein
MKNGVGVAQNIVLFGGTSEIGQAIIEKLVKPGVSHVVLVAVISMQPMRRFPRFPNDIQILKFIMCASMPTIPHRWFM